MFFQELRQMLVELLREGSGRALCRRSVVVIALLAAVVRLSLYGLVSPVVWAVTLLVLGLLFSLMAFRSSALSSARLWALAGAVLSSTLIPTTLTMMTGGFRSINLPVDVLVLTLGSTLFPQPFPLLLGAINVLCLALTTTHAPGAWLPWRQSVLGSAAILAGARLSGVGHAAVAEGQHNLRIQQAGSRLGGTLTTLDMDRIVAETALTLGTLAEAECALVVVPAGDADAVQIHTWHPDVRRATPAVPESELLEAAERALRYGVPVLASRRGIWYVPGGPAAPRSWPVAVAIPMGREDLPPAAVAVSACQFQTLPPWLVDALTQIAVQAGLGIRAARAHAATQQQALVDPVTRLHNVRFLTTRLEEEVARARRAGQPLSLLFLDSDSLKATNDRFGHAFGDLLVRALAEMIVEQVRQYDIPVRYSGGDEFVVLLPNTDWPEAADVAERLRVQAHEIPVGPAREKLGSVSIGVATFPLHAGTASDLLSCADQAMYQAKMAGKDRVAIYGTANVVR